MIRNYLQRVALAGAQTGQPARPPVSAGPPLPGRPYVAPLAPGEAPPASGAADRPRGLEIGTTQRRPVLSEAASPVADMADDGREPAGIFGARTAPAPTAGTHAPSSAREASGTEFGGASDRADLGGPAPPTASVGAPPARAAHASVPDPDAHVVSLHATAPPEQTATGPSGEAADVRSISPEARSARPADASDPRALRDVLQRVAPLTREPAVVRAPTPLRPPPPAATAAMPAGRSSARAEAPGDPVDPPAPAPVGERAAHAVQPAPPSPPALMMAPGQVAGAQREPRISIGRVEVAVHHPPSAVPDAQPKPVRAAAPPSFLDLRYLTRFAWRP